MDDEARQMINALDKKIDDLYKTHTNLKIIVEGMKSNKNCDEHINMVKENAVSVQIVKDFILTHQKFEALVVKHIDEGEREGGARDKINRLRTDVDSINKNSWRMNIVCGIVGGLIGSNTPLVINAVFKWMGIIK